MTRSSLPALWEGISLSTGCDVTTIPEIGADSSLPEPMARGDSRGDANSSKTILLAEDEPQLRDLFGRVLEQSGFSVLVAKDAQEALDIVNRSTAPIDLLVSNVQMPRMTGPDLAKEIRRNHPNVRVLLISGYSQGVLILDEGWHFLKKPFVPAAIVEKVNEILSKPQASEVDQG
jgi:two-component system, cell cycle sensor histidine kinase and response regulator CckA